MWHLILQYNGGAQQYVVSHTLLSSLKFAHCSSDTPLCKVSQSGDLITSSNRALTPDENFHVQSLELFT